MRKLASTLGVNPMSLYHHVPNKAALLRGVTVMVAAQFQTSTDAQTWEEQLGQLAHDFRSLAHRHSNLFLHGFASPDFIQREDPLWLAVCRVLAAAGVPASDIHSVGAVLVSLVSGFILSEISGVLGHLSTLSPADRPPGTDGATDTDPAEMGERADRAFGFAVQTVIAGVTARLGPSAA
jgi:AcrR family transcriptional regulator